jgi:hypothetical protein
MLRALDIVGVVPVLDAGEEGARFWYAMKWIDGETLSGCAKGESPAHRLHPMRERARARRSPCSYPRRRSRCRDSSPGFEAVEHDDRSDGRARADRLRDRAFRNDGECSRCRPTGSSARLATSLPSP